MRTKLNPKGIYLLLISDRVIYTLSKRFGPRYLVNSNKLVSNWKERLMPCGKTVTEYSHVQHLRVYKKDLKKINDLTSLKIYIHRNKERIYMP